ncbi:MAG: EamA family transporter [Aquabacterium sp.]|jgi:drug/metabolite transporter (DMT)-like permease|nr:EamA family transporter [Aquabacterium sp.]
MTPLHRPALQGGLLALGAAMLFGISTPLVQAAGQGLGAFSTASLLYAGAALLGALLRQPVEREARLQRTDGSRLFGMALFGAVIGPVCLAWGLQHTSGTSASLMLTLEAVFTAILARLLYREVIDRKVWAAMALLTGGGALLVVEGHQTGQAQFLGILAVMAATTAWGVDNTLSRPLADRDPGQVVLAKSALGASFTALLAWMAHESAPTALQAAALLGIGATGYGLSLRLYLLAQRSFGAARTGSVFAFAPFIGALFAMGLQDRSITWGVVAGGLLMLLGIALHLSESHAHEHQHDALLHEHAHTHDDGHHNHPHDPMPQGAHSHMHSHEPMRHTHPHAPDLHHAHHH